MKGANRLLLNYDTVVDAITEYLAKHMVTPPIVHGVSVTLCSTWHTSPIRGPDGKTVMPGDMEVLIQEPVAFLKGEK